MAAARGAERYIRITVDSQAAMRQLGRTTRAAEDAAQRLRFLQRAAVAAFGAFAIREAVGAAGALTAISDAATETVTRLQGVAGGVEGAVDAFRDLVDLGNELGVSATALSRAYTRLGVTLPNTEHEELLRLVETLQFALKASGASAQEAASATLQWSQGMGSGIVRGEELNSLLEAAPVLMQAWQMALGDTSTSVKELGEQGAFTAESYRRLQPVILDNVRELTGIEKLATTVSGGMQAIRNEIDALFVGMSAESGGGLSEFGAALHEIAAVIPELRPLLVVLVQQMTEFARATAEVIPQLEKLFNQLRFLRQLGPGDLVDEPFRFFRTFRAFSEDADYAEHTLKEINRDIQEVARQLTFPIGGLARERLIKELQELGKEAVKVREEIEAVNAPPTITVTTPAGFTTPPPPPVGGGGGGASEEQRLAELKRQQEELWREQRQLESEQAEVMRTMTQTRLDALERIQDYELALVAIQKERQAEQEAYLRELGSGFTESFAQGSGTAAEGAAAALRTAMTREFPDGMIADLVGGPGGFDIVSIIGGNQAPFRNMGKLLAETGAEWGVTAANSLGRSLQETAGAAAAGTTIGQIAAQTLFERTSGLGTALGGLGGALAGAPFGAGGALAGSALGSLAGGGLESIFGGGGDGVRQMRAVFEYVDGELQANASRLGQNAGQFNQLVAVFNDAIGDMVGLLDQDTQAVVNALNIRLDRSSSSSLEEFSTKIGQIVTGILSEAADVGGRWAQYMEGLWHESGRNMDQFSQQLNRFVTVANSLGAAANNLAGSDVLDGMDQLADLVLKLGEADAQAITSNINSLDQLMDSLKSDAQQLSEAQSAVTRVFSSLNMAVPQSIEAFQMLVTGLDLTTEQGLRAAGALGAISGELSTYFEALRQQEDALEDVGEATVDFVALMQGALDALVSVQDTLGRWREQVTDFGLSDEQLYERRKDSIDELVKLLDYADLTPEEIARTVSEIERLSREAWGLLTDEQRALQQQELIGFLNEVERLATTRLQEQMDAIERASGGMNDQMKAIMRQFDERVRLGAERLKDAGVAAGSQLRIIGNQVDKYRQAANILNQAGNRNATAAQRLMGSVNQLDNVSSNFGGSAHGFRQSTISFHHSVNGFNHGVKTFVNSTHELKRYVGTQNSRIEGNSARIRQLEAYNRGPRDERNANVR